MLPQQIRFISSSPNRDENVMMMCGWCEEGVRRVSYLIVVAVSLQFLDHRSHLDGLRSCAENNQDFLHLYWCWFMKRNRVGDILKRE